MSGKNAADFNMRAHWPVPGEGTFRAILERRANTDPDHPFCVWEGGQLTVRELHERSTKLANALLDLGIGKGDVVALMLDQHAEHIIALYACAQIGVARTSVNVNAKGDYLSLLLADARPTVLIAEVAYRPLLEQALDTTEVPHVVWNDQGGAGELDILIEAGAATPPALSADPDDPLVINYTSGTTGAPKKFSRSDRVVQIGSVGCLLIGEMVPGDVLLFWEPLYHGAGHQTVFAAIMEKLTLALVPRFSASRFWDQARSFNATKIHYIGGILPILLKQPARDNERDHSVKIAWGAGCPEDIGEEFERRFGVVVNEGYGLSEVANYVSINVEGPRGAIGKPLPWFSVRIVDEEEKDVPQGETGEIVVKGKSEDYTSVSLNKVQTRTQTGWIKTGDLGRFDVNGYLFFTGRKSDSLRRRGENVSAWEVERIVARHPSVEECALIGVDSGLGAGDDDLKLFVKLKPQETLEPLELIRWCEDKMPYFQIPRYIAFAPEFPKTPSQRIRKAELSKSTNDCWDLQDCRYVLKR
ncbi:AMP-binding protein [Nitratireductor soli]|uniref:AMP-binding protein n=1 Tax=Nitratireductor soli TaxID=1670619 RepID=UPI000AFA5207|nr:AMP-binding protein [Nitratireductor soli]